MHFSIKFTFMRAILIDKMTGKDRYYGITLKHPFLPVIFPIMEGEKHQSTHFDLSSYLKVQDKELVAICTQYPVGLEPRDPARQASALPTELFRAHRSTFKICLMNLQLAPRSKGNKVRKFFPII